MPDPYAEVDRSEMLAGAEQSEPISLASDWSSDTPWRAIVAATGGIIKGRLINDAADRDLPIVAGIPTSYRLVLIRSTANGTTAAGLVRLR